MIAAEKAGIFRPKVQALTSARHPGALAELKLQAKRIGATLATPDETAVEVLDSGWRLRCPEGAIELPPPSLQGGHQIENGALAARAALLLRNAGWNIPDSAIASGMASARWPGRLQKISDSPATFLDGAHNPDGCAVLARFVNSLPPPRALVFACMKDKPYAEMAKILWPAFDAIWITGLPMKRCAKPDEILSAAPWPNVRVIDDVPRALEEARAFAGADGSVVAAGSLYLAGRLLQSTRAQEATLFGTGL